MHFSRRKHRKPKSRAAIRRNTHHRSVALERLEPLAMLSGGSVPPAATPSISVNDGVHDAVVKEDHSVIVPITASHGPGASSNEVLTITITGIQSSWGTFSAPVGSYNAATTTWTVTLAPAQNLSTQFTFTPNHDSDVDLANLHATATAFDPASNTSASAAQDFSVVTDAVADVPTISAHDTAGNENTAVAISLSGAVTDIDGSETITGYKISGAPDGFGFNHGTNTGGGVWTFTPTDLNGLTLSSPANFFGTVHVTATVLNAETNLSGKEVDFTDNTNSNSADLSVTWKATADAPTISVNSGVANAIAKEDHTILVPITAGHGAHSSPNEILTITVTGISTNWGTFSAPVGTYDAIHGTWTVTLAPGQNLNTAFTFTPALNSDADLSNLHASVTAFEPATSTSASAATDFTVVTDAVADVPTITVRNATGNENTAVAISLSGAVTDTDGSETITGYKISGVPTGFTFNHGTNAGSGVWTFTPTDITGLMLTPASNFTGTLNLTATVLNAETNLSGQEVDFTDNTNSASANFTVTWNPLGPALLPQLVSSGIPASSSPTSFVVVGTLTYFTANDGVHGTELWKTNGTAAGTVLVKDINPGAVNSSPFGLTNVNGALFFFANDGVHGSELWKSDGTVAGTVLVKDINPGAADSVSFTTKQVAINNVFYFSASDGTNTGLWKSDGTAAGTVLVADISQADSYNYYGQSEQINALTNINGTLYFSTFSSPGLGGRGSDLTGLWKSDGTAAGTIEIAEINPGNARNSIASFISTNVNGKFFFNFEDNLWVSDGTTAGTAMVSDNSGSYLYGAYFLTNVNGTLFFAGYDRSSNDIELWKTDGTSPGTVEVKDFGGESFYFGSTSTPQNLANVNGTLFFTVSDPVAGPELWKSDGTTSGTVLVKTINPGTSSTTQYISDLVNLNGTLFFNANDGTHGSELWKSDGSAAGTVMVKDIAAASSNPQFLTNFNGTLLFSATDDTHGLELWRSNGSTAGTTLVDDINPFQQGFTDPGQLTSANGKLFFIGDNPFNVPLYATDAVSGKTTFLMNLDAPTFLSNFDNSLFFIAFDNVNRFALWKSDGTIAGTVEVSELSANAIQNPQFGGAYQPLVVGGMLYFGANDGQGPELWRTDGTTAGTTVVKLLDSFPSNFTNVGGTIFFITSDAANGTTLWKSDGSAVGTTKIKQISPLPTSQLQTLDLTSVNNELFFSANDGTHGQELWESNGTTAGTVMVKNIRADLVQYGNTYGYGSYPAELTNVGGTLFFTANDGTNGVELWKSDGTATGTILVKDIFPGSSTRNYTTYPNSSYPANLTSFNGGLLFTANDGVNGTELWKSDGTTAGTVIVKDINPGTYTANNQTYPSSSFPSYLTNINGVLYFAANNSASGLQIWTTDGTSTGTRLASTENPTVFFALTNLINVSGTLFFTANTDDNLFSSNGVLQPLQLYRFAPLPGDFNQDGLVDVRDLQPAMQALANPDAYSATYNVPVSSISTVGDVNGDGNFNNLDLQALLNLLLSGGGSTSTETSNTESSVTNNSIASTSSASNASLAPPPTAENVSSLTSAETSDVSLAPPPTAGDSESSSDAAPTTITIAPTSIDSAPTLASNTRLAPPPTAGDSASLPSEPPTDGITASPAPASFQDIPIAPQPDSISSLIFTDHISTTADAPADPQTTSPQHLQLAAIDWALQSATDYRNRHAHWLSDTAPTDANLSSDNLLPTVLAN